MNDALRALNRFGLGARPGEPAELRDPRGWLHGQLRPDAARIDDGSLPDLDDAATAIGGIATAQRDRDQDALRMAARRGMELFGRESLAALGRRLTTAAPFVERLVAFWSNHLCVSATAKRPVTALAGLYERQVVRPHVLGRYEDMMLASARHPAMLLYLDNAQSIGPGSRASRFVERTRGVDRGLNENYARELLELHTLGVDGGYDQADVEELARVFTGWTVSGMGPLARSHESVGFAFRELMHEPGSKTVLGRRYGEAGVREGERVIVDLCRHPSTARFVADKLARHFVADEPPEASIDRLTTVFRDSGGDLLAVSHALVDLPEAWLPEHRKFRTPQDWLVAVGRALELPTLPPRMIQILRQLRHPLWGPPSPKGYDDDLRSWADPDSLMNRAELAKTIADAVGRRRSVPELLSVIETSDDGALSVLWGDSSIPADDRLALLVASPDFQWR